MNSEQRVSDAARLPEWTAYACRVCHRLPYVITPRAYEDGGCAGNCGHPRDDSLHGRLNALVEMGRALGIYIMRESEAETVATLRIRCDELLESAMAALEQPKPAEAKAEGAVVSAIEVFRIAGGDVECCPAPTAEQALDCLRDLRECYNEALANPEQPKVEPPRAVGDVTDAMVDEALAAQVSFYEAPENSGTCNQCSGSGQWGGDWCDGCGGAGVIFTATDRDEMRAAIRAAIAAAPKAGEAAPTAEPWHEARLEMTVVDGKPRFAASGWHFKGNGGAWMQSDFIKAVLRWGIGNIMLEPGPVTVIAATDGGEG